MVHSDFLSVGSSYLLPLPVSPKRHRDIVPIPIYEMRQAEACAVDPGQLRTIQQVSGPWPLGDTQQETRGLEAQNVLGASQGEANEKAEAGVKLPSCPID